MMNRAMSESLKESSGGIVGWWSRGLQFIAEVRVELSRVTWPTRREVWATTIVVILVSMLFGIYLYAVDLGLNVIMARILRIGS